MSVLAAIGGAHFLESIFVGGPPAPGVFSLEDFHLAVAEAHKAVAESKAMVEAMEPPKKLVLKFDVALDAAVKDVLSTLANTPKSLALKTFRSVDLIITSGLLAGGSAGIRAMLHTLTKKEE